MMKKQKTIQDLSWGEMHQGAFLSEGRIVAFPLGFPGGTIPIVADESHITALDLAPNGDVYGGTGGRAAHLFAGYFRQATGAVFDFGAITGADSCAAVCCGHNRLIGLVNGSQGGRMVSLPIQYSPGVDLLQEWGFSRPPYEELGSVNHGERLVHAVTDEKNEWVAGVSQNHLFLVNFDSKKIEIVEPLAGNSQIGQGSDNRFFGKDEDDSLWRFDLAAKVVKRHAVKLPKGNWNGVFLRWARDNQTDSLYTADAEGRMFVVKENGAVKGPLAQTPLAPVTSMAVTHDGRVFGTCGAEMEHLFVYNPKSKELRDLGIAVSVIERRRYGYQFGDAVTGLDGEIYFGERDDLGHLWMYFPRIEGDSQRRIAMRGISIA